MDQSEQFKHEFGPRLCGGTNEFWYSNVCSCSGMASSHFFDYQSSIKNLCGRSLGQHKYDWNLWVCTARNKSLLDGILKLSYLITAAVKQTLLRDLLKKIFRIHLGIIDIHYLYYRYGFETISTFKKQENLLDESLNFC